ncbi:MAG: aminopeptidase [Bryobacterales bacterium]|nr:aminopeptidase [Bryobacterales bacterium]
MLDALTFDPAFETGARNAIHTCLRVQPDEQVTIITDLETAPIAAALRQQLRALHAPHNVWVLEHAGTRPLIEMPRAILDDLESANVSIFCAQAKTGELPSRMQMTEVVNRRKIRHAHMVNITPEIMTHGMRADYDAVDRLSLKLLELARHAKTVRATTPAGTDIVAAMSPDYKWLKTSGIISANTWGNLPGGEVWTTPGEVNGVYVVDGVVGDYLCAKYGDLQQTPLTVHVKANRVHSVDSANRELAAEFWDYTHSGENSDRVGEFAIGTNIGVRDVIGNILQDEKIPGMHIAFGHPYGDHTGATWVSKTHIDIVGRRFSIWLDGLQIMENGRFLVTA